MLLAGMYCDNDGGHRVDLRDAVTGETISAYCHYKEWWNDPSEHFTAFRRDGRAWPIATTIGGGTTAWAITRTGHITSLTITAAQIHPSARPSPQR